MRWMILVVALAGCQSVAEVTSDDISAERGAVLFADQCAGCHGESAMGGEGPDLTRLTARAGGTFPWEAVLTQIDGLGRHGEISGMPEFGALGLGPTVVVERDGLGVPVPVDLLALVGFLEGVQR